MDIRLSTMTNLQSCEIGVKKMKYLQHQHSAWRTSMSTALHTTTGKPTLLDAEPGPCDSHCFYTPLPPQEPPPEDSLLLESSPQTKHSYGIWPAYVPVNDTRTAAAYAFICATSQLQSTCTMPSHFGAGPEHRLLLTTMGTNNDNRHALSCLHCQQLFLLTDQHCMQE